MNNKELQEYLKQYPDDLEILLIPDIKNWSQTIPFTDENILHTSETAYVDDEADEDDWDCEDGKVELGEGKRYLLFNPLIV